MSINLYTIHSKLNQIESEKMELCRAMADCDEREHAVRLLQKEVDRLDGILKAAYAVEIPNETADKIKIW